MTEIGATQLEELKAILSDMATNQVRLSLVIKEIESAQFLTELSAKDAEYDVAFMAAPASEPEPETPNLDDIKPINPPMEEKPEVQELAKRLDLEQTGEAALGVAPELWERLVKTFVIAGWNMRKLLDSEWWKKQSLTLTPKEAKRLDELSLLRDQMILKEMDLAQVQGQNGITEIEKAAFAELAQKENLK